MRSQTGTGSEDLASARGRCTSDDHACYLCTPADATGKTWSEAALGHEVVPFSERSLRLVHVRLPAQPLVLSIADGNGAHAAFGPTSAHLICHTPTTCDWVRSRDWLDGDARELYDGKRGSTAGQNSVATFACPATFQCPSVRSSGPSVNDAEIPWSVLQFCAASHTRACSAS